MIKVTDISYSYGFGKVFDKASFSVGKGMTVGPNGAGKSTLFRLLRGEDTPYEVTIDALKAYTGAMIFVSHTKEFFDELSPHRVLLLPENRIEYWIPEMIESVGKI